MKKSLYLSVTICVFLDLFYLIFRSFSYFLFDLFFLLGVDYKREDNRYKIETHLDSNIKEKTKVSTSF